MQIRRKIACSLALVLLSACATASEQPFFRVGFTDRTGWVFGGESFVTEDGGASWHRVKLGYMFAHGADALLSRSQVSVTDSGTIWTVYPRLRRTTDRGASWETLGGEGLTRLSSIFLLSDAFALADSSSEPKLFRTNDGGVTWSEVLHGGGYLGAVVFWDERKIYAASRTRLLESQDAGLSWSVSKKFDRFVYGLKRSDTALWIVGSRGLCYRFDPESGAYSDYSPPAGRLDLYDIGVRNGQILVAGYGGALFVSPEQLPAWRRVPLDTDANLVSVAFSPSDGTAYVVGGVQEGMLPGIDGTPRRIALFSKDLLEWRELSLPTALK